MPCELLLLFDSLYTVVDIQNNCEGNVCILIPINKLVTDLKKYKFMCTVLIHK